MMYIRLFTLLIIALLSPGCGKTIFTNPIIENSAGTIQTTTTKIKPNPLYTATSLENQANATFLAKDYENAEILFQQAYQIRVKELGSTHTSLTNNLYNLATIYEVKQQYIEAEALYKQAINIFQLHKKQTDAKIYLGFLTAIQYLKNINHTPAHLNNQLTAYKQLQDPNNIRVSAIHHRLATNYLQSKNYKAAELAFKNAMQICQQHTGINHPYYSLILKDYSHLLRITQQNRQAQQMISRIHSILSRFPKKSHTKLYQVESISIPN